MGDNQLAAEIVQTMLDKQVEGIILAPTDALDSEVERMLKSKMPLVLFDRKIPNLPTNYVGTNNYEASREAVEHLLEQGYEHIGMVTITSQQPQMQDRLRAYQDVLAENGSKEQLLYTSFLDKDENPVKAISRWLKKNPEIDALFFSTNYVCVAGLKAMRKLEREQQLGIIAFDDLELLELMRPQISCIRQPLEKIAKAVVQMLIDQLSDKDKAPSEKIIRSNIQIRESSL